MMLWKCCTQYASKFGKLSSGFRTRKGQFSFQSQRKAMPKNVQTTAQLHSSHTLAKKCSKFSKLGFNTTWTKRFQMYKLCSEKAEEPENKSYREQTDIHWIIGKTREFQKNIYLCFFDYEQTDVDNLISGSSAFLKSSLNIWKFLVHILLKPSLENFEHYFSDRKSVV